MVSLLLCVSHTDNLCSHGSVSFYELPTAALWLISWRSLKTTNHKTWLIHYYLLLLLFHFDMNCTSWLCYDYVSLIGDFQSFMIDKSKSSLSPISISTLYLEASLAVSPDSKCSVYLLCTIELSMKVYGLSKSTSCLVLCPITDLLKVWSILCFGWYRESQRGERPASRQGEVTETQLTILVSKKKNWLMAVFNGTLSINQCKVFYHFSNYITFREINFQT